MDTAGPPAAQPPSKPQALTPAAIAAVAPVAFKGIIPDETWLALGTLTESNRPAEWPWVMQIIVGRARRRGHSIYQVIREPWQFSAFNGYRHVPIEQETTVFEAVRKELGAGEKLIEVTARICARAILDLPPECSILPPGTFDYWSPRSMLPAGSLPHRWNWHLLHCFTVPGVPQERFVFAQDQPAGAAGTSNQAQYGREA